MNKAAGTGVGKGHGSNSKLPPCQEITKTARAQLLLRSMVPMGVQPDTRVFQLGRCTIFLSPPFGGNGWHMSISHPDRYPTWDEVAKAWYDLVPDAENRSGAMILPPKAEYVNIANHCFQVHEEMKR